MYRILDFLFLFYFFPLFYSFETGFFSVYPSISTVTTMYQHACLSIFQIFQFLIFLMAISYHSEKSACNLKQKQTNKKTEIFECVYAKGILEYWHQLALGQKISL